MKRLLALFLFLGLNASGQTNTLTVSEPTGLRDLFLPENQNLTTSKSHNGTVSNDLFVVAGDVSLNGTYRDDVWAAAQQTVFTGNAEDDVRLFAVNTIRVNGTIEDSLDAIAPAGNIVIDTNAVVKGDSFIFAGRNATLQGTFEGDVVVRGNRITVDSQIGGSLTLHAQEVLILPGSHIQGDFLYSTPEPLTLNTTMVSGTIQEITAMETGKAFWTFPIIHWVAALFTGLLLLRTLPQFTGNCVECAFQRRGPSIMMGGMSGLLLGAVTLLSAQSGVGIGFAAILAGVLFFLLYVGKLIIALAIGAMLLRQWQPFTFWKLSLSFIAGLVLLYTTFQIPYIGSSFWMLVSFWGMGAMLQVIAASQRPIKVEIPPSLAKEDESLLS